MDMARWDDPAKQEHAYECFLTSFGDEHGFSDEQMNEFVLDARELHGAYALSEQNDSITEMENDLCHYWRSHDHHPFDPFTE